MPTLSEKLAQLLYQADMTQIQLANALNTKQQNVSRWLSGNAYPRENMMRKIAEVFGVLTSDLKKDDRELPPKESMEHMQIMRLSVKEGREMLPKNKKSAAAFSDASMQGRSALALASKNSDRVDALENEIALLKKQIEEIQKQLASRTSLTLQKISAADKRKEFLKVAKKKNQAQ